MSQIQALVCVCGVLAVLVTHPVCTIAGERDGGRAHKHHHQHIEFSVRSVKSGRWSEAKTWKPARIPRKGDRVSSVVTLGLNTMSQVTWSFAWYRSSVRCIFLVSATLVLRWGCSRYRTATCAPKAGSHAILRAPTPTVSRSKPALEKCPRWKSAHGMPRFPPSTRRGFVCIF